MKSVKIGVLPLYIKLYDDFVPAYRAGMEKLYSDVLSAIRAEGAEVLAADVCRIRPEFEAAVKSFEAAGVDAIVTINLAYSPSLESAEVLAGTKLPILVLDTTRDYCFDFNVAAGSVSYNHGIHGVQDICNLLRRLGKDYSVFAGHFTESDVVRRTVDAARAIKAANSLSGMRVGTIGGAFEGMGDFTVSKETFSRLGLVRVDCDGERLSAISSRITDEDVRAEYELDCKINGASAVPYEKYANTHKTALAVREWIKEEGLSGFTMNFLGVGKTKGFDIIPFTEACKQMAAGVGDAGEGDLIDAALVGALMGVYDEVNFVEMFCPDWKNSSVYFNHMGECNAALMENRRMLTKPFAFAKSEDPTYLIGNMKAGVGCVFNMLPNADGWYDVVIVEGEMMQVPDVLENFKSSINGWFKPKTEVSKLLAGYSELGGTHHSAFVYGVDSSSLALFAKTLGMKCTVI